ncbi:MFS transporter [Nocardiopsis algeriensis]|uniref:MFS transporter n=1 Tax=Nocardiopsis algeriensis TaxID=1478215 RepID=UPI003B438453
MKSSPRPVFDVLRLPGFRNLVAARFLALIGNGTAPVALAFGVMAAGGSGADIGIVVAARGFALLPGLLLGGALADRFSRTAVMAWSDAVAGLSAAFTAYLFGSGGADTWSLAAAQAVNGAAASFFLPASKSVVPMVVPPAQRQAANSLMSLSMQFGVVLGSAGAGIAVANLGAGWAMSVNALTFFASAVLVSRMRLPPVAATGESVLRSIRTGWREFSSHRWVLVVVVQFMVIMSAFHATLNVLGPLAAERHLGGPASWGFVLAANSTGYILGGLVALRVRARYPLRVAVLMTLLFAAPGVCLALATGHTWIVAAGTLVNGVGATVFTVLWDTLLQQRIPPRYLSRVASYDALGSLAAVPVGTAAAGLLSEAVPLNTALWACSAVILVSGLVTLCFRDVRNLTGVDEQAAPT